MSHDLALMLTLLVPAASVPLLVVTGAKPNLREGVTLVTGVILFALVITLWSAVADAGRPSLVLVETLPGLPLALEAEPLGMIFALVASMLWIVTSVYSIGYMRGHKEKNQTRFYVCFAIAIFSAMGVAFAANMFTLFVFYELLTISTYPLVTHSGTPEAKRAGRVYLGILIGTSIGLQLVAMVWIWTLTGTLDFTLGGVLTGKVEGPMVAVLYALFAFGVGKAALMPFHRWLPAAMVAPTPVSALLHAVAVVKAGVFTILKVTVYLFGIDTLSAAGATDVLIYVAAGTILLASLVAMTRDNLKSRLAYSTVSQLSYIVLGAMLANVWGIAGAGMHIVMHAFGKITLFFCAGAIMVATHKTEVSQLNGVGRRMPLTMIAFMIGSLCIIGAPPFGGMWSKWYLVIGTLKADQVGLLAVLLVSSLLNVFYLLDVPLRAFFASEVKAEPDQEHALDQHGEHDATSHDGSEGRAYEAPLPCLLAIGFTSLGCIALFFFPGSITAMLAQVTGPLQP